MSICKKCIIPDTFRGVKFEGGICSFCRREEPLGIHRQALGKQKLAELLVSIQNKSGYHCVVPFSGGKDSSYVLFYISRVLGLNPIAVHYDSGFCSAAAISNIRGITGRLKVKLITVKANFFHREMIRHILSNGNMTGGFVACRNCENMLRSAAIVEAEKRKIPFIVWGSSDFEENPEDYLKKDYVRFRDSFGSKNPAARSYSLPRFSFFTRAHSLKSLALFWFRAKLAFLTILDNMFSPMPRGVNRLNPSLRVSFGGRRTKVVYFFDYIAYEPSLFIDTIKKELGWQSSSGRESRMDCRLHCFVNYDFLLKHGITADGSHLGALVREGLLDREEALSREETIRSALEEECRGVLKELKIPVRLKAFTSHLGEPRKK